jgi:ribonuclease PH
MTIGNNPPGDGGIGNRGVVRADGRNPADLRPIEITLGVQKWAEGSALIRFGDTQVLCAATIEDRVPPHLRGKGTGWVTGTYEMLPRATARLGERTVTVDCDVIVADGGTRTASITGGYVALAAALMTYGMERHLVGHVAAVSVGIIDGVKYLDLDYSEDSRAEVDFNVVGTDAGAYVELQGTAEGKPFDRASLDELLDLANAGLAQLFAAQTAALATVRR